MGADLNVVTSILFRCSTFLTFFERQEYPFIEHIASLQTHDVLFLYSLMQHQVPCFQQTP